MPPVEANLRCATCCAAASPAGHQARRPCILAILSPLFYLPWVLELAAWALFRLTPRESCPSDLWHLRVVQLVQDGSLHLGHVQYFVLDECDKMLETTGGHPGSAELQSKHMAVPHLVCPWPACQVLLGSLAACGGSLPPTCTLSASVSMPTSGTCLIPAEVLGCSMLWADVLTGSMPWWACLLPAKVCCALPLQTCGAMCSMCSSGRQFRSRS